MTPGAGGAAQPGSTAAGTGGPGLDQVAALLSASGQELLARVRAHLRRAPERAATAIEAGDFVVDVTNHSVAVLGKAIHLTPKEFDLLAHLARHAGKVITHRALLTAVWGAQSAHQPEYLRVFVGQLRKKLEAETDRQYIQTEPWVGYRFIPEGWSGNED